MRDGEEIGRNTSTVPASRGHTAVPPPARGSRPVNPLFTAFLMLCEAGDDDSWKEWQRVHDEITRTLTPAAPSGPVPEHLLHVRGDRAEFRWSDEPFNG